MKPTPETPETQALRILIRYRHAEATPKIPHWAEEVDQRQEALDHDYTVARFGVYDQFDVVPLDWDAEEYEAEEAAWRAKQPKQATRPAPAEYDDTPF